MQSVVKELFEFSRNHHEESEAVISIALMIMHCDENITNDEVNVLDRIIFITRFDKDSKLAEFVAKARLDIIERVHSMEDMKFYIDQCVSHIKTPVIKSSLVKMAELIATAVHEYCDSESQLIEYLSESICRHH